VTEQVTAEVRDNSSTTWMCVNYTGPRALSLWQIQWW